MKKLLFIIFLMVFSFVITTNGKKPKVVWPKAVLTLSKRIRDAAFFLIIMLVTFAATLLNPQKYVSSRTIQKCVEHVSTST